MTCKCIENMQMSPRKLGNYDSIAREEDQNCRSEKKTGSTWILYFVSLVAKKAFTTHFQQLFLQQPSE